MYIEKKDKSQVNWGWMWVWSEL